MSPEHELRSIEAGMTAMGSVPEGWAARAATTLDAHIGPFYSPGDGASDLYGFLADARHANRRGVVHGGIIALTFDVTLGRAAFGNQPCATIQLDVQFMSPMNLGEFATIRCETVRITRSLIFMRGAMTCGERIIATANGIWKVLSAPDPARGASPAPQVG